MVKLTHTKEALKLHLTIQIRRGENGKLKTALELLEIRSAEIVYAQMSMKNINV